MDSGCSGTGDHSRVSVFGTDHRTMVSIDGVIGPGSTRIAACLATGLLTVGTVTFAGSAPASAAESAPLLVSIDSMPASLPSTGEVTVTGHVTNRSKENWTDLNVYLLTSLAPLTTDAELADAQRTDPLTDIGGRLTAAELFDPVGDLEPGASVDYTLSVPREELQITGAAGVYWLGVHVLGASEEGRVDGADGRARTFIPLMEPDGPRTTMSLVMPLEAGIRRDTEGRLKNLDTWRELLGPQGRLGRLLRLSDASTTTPVTWVLDPAVVDAAISVAGDNPAISTAPDDGEETEPTEPDGNSSSAPSDLTSDDPSDDEPELPAQAERAEGWLASFRRQAERHTVLAVAYGGADVASMLRRTFDELFVEATELSARTMEGLDVETSPVVAPANGFLPRQALTSLDTQTPVLLSEAAVPAATETVMETDRGLRIVLGDSSVASGGPTPTPAYRALALRQRILSEVAVHALSSNGKQPLVVSTPQLWNPGGQWRRADFLSGLDQPWLRTVDLSTLTATANPPDPDKDANDVGLSYPRAEARAELPLANLLATEELGETGEVLADLLTQNGTVDATLAKSAFLASTYLARRHPNAAAATARESNDAVRSLMDRVRIEGPSFVTMSSEEGTFAITLVNDLNEPVTVGVKAETGSTDLVIASPDVVSLGPGQRASVRLQATSLGVGLHSVSLLPTNSNGQALGSATRFNVRSSQVGLVIWIILGVGVTLLFLASGVRIIKRVRTRGSTRAPRLKGAAG